MIQLLCKIEQKLKQLRLIGNQDTLSLVLTSDGSGVLLTKSIKNGIFKEFKILDYDNLAAFYIKVGDILGKEAKWKDS